MRGEDLISGVDLCAERLVDPEDHTPSSVPQRRPNPRQILGAVASA